MDDSIRRRNVNQKSSENDDQTEEKHPSSVVKPPVKRSRCKQCMLWFWVILLLWCLVGYLRCPITVFESDEVKVELTGVFSVNSDLTKGIRIPGLPGPESVMEDSSGNLFTGLADGRIVKIIPDKHGSFVNAKIENITNGLIPDADVTTKDFPHGRPSGIFLSGDRLLYVADCVYGLYSVDVVSKKVTILASPNNITPKLAFPNDLSVSDDGKLIYFTDVNEDFPLTKVIYGILSGGCTGRVLQYNVESKQLSVVASGLCGANGVQVLSDPQMVLVVEMYPRRITWIDVKTGESIQSVPMPMMPDAITRVGDRYWIAGSLVPRYISSYVNRYPVIRQTLAGMLPHNMCGIFLLAVFNNFQHNIIVEISENGEVLRSMSDPNAQLTYALSRATPLKDGRIALGSFAAPFLAIVDN